MSQDVLIKYGQLFGSGVDLAMRGISADLMVVIVHGEDFYRIDFAGGNTRYRRTSDEYKADALAGRSSDEEAAVVSKRIRGRSDVTVLVADYIGGETSSKDLKAAAERIATKLTAILKDAKL
ncbi:MAG TPA: hypothetical protein VJ841_00845 [Candidatus Saccharimonadales bacterium]|nr:hypothetical protein [Candidatus Saccharimonadales bacterium]